MKIKFNKTQDSDLLAELLADLPRRMKNVATEVGRAVTAKTEEEVKKRLSGRGGWVQIYHDAIIYRESPEGNHWAVAGYTTAHPELFKYPAKTSLLTVSGIGNLPEGQNPSLVISQYQPWPIDVIPALTMAYPGKAEIKMYDEGTVETYREAAVRNLPAIREAIENTGFKIDEDGFPSWDEVYADIAFMARRLELGYTGYPRVPHWGPAGSALQSQGVRWATAPAVLKLIESALRGEDPVEVAKMSSAQAAEFARIRAASWS